MWTVVNLIDRFSSEYDFYVVTRNYDSRDDKTPYTSVKTGEWNKVHNANVYYASNSLITQRNFKDLVTSISPDLIFLNSVFCTLSVKFLIARKRGLIPDIPVVLAPCGELSTPSLSLKKAKKRTFLMISKLFHLFDKVIWKASTPLEKDEIKSAISNDSVILIAPDLPPKTVLSEFQLHLKPLKIKGEVTLSFVSRVVRKKNLYFLLKALETITDYKIRLDIVGPLEDQEYWKECEKIINNMPPNIEINVIGGVTYQLVLDNLIKSHFFILPTLNENFGYVFIEAMAAGCPLIISDRTIWNELETNGIGWNIPLKSFSEWAHIITTCTEMNDGEYRLMASKARSYANAWLNDPKIENATANVLKKALHQES